MRLALILLFSLSLSACISDDMTDLEEFVANAAAEMRGKIPPAPEVMPYEPFPYENEAAIPDPFKPRAKGKTGGGGVNAPDFDRPREALEEYALETLKMVGYLNQHNKSYAVVRAPDSKLHRIKVGNYLGQDFGKIVEITDVEIVIKETVQDSVGDWSERISGLQLLE